MIGKVGIGLKNIGHYIEQDYIGDKLIEKDVIGKELLQLERVGMGRFRLEIFWLKYFY